MIVTASVLAVCSGAALAASPACTIHWTGPSSGGEWSSAANWNLGRAPTTGDVVCISGVTGTVTYDGTGSSSTTLLASLRSSAPLQLSGGELAFTDASVTSTIAGLSITGGQLGDTSNPDGPVTVNGAFSFTSGTITAPTPSTSDPEPTLTVPRADSATLNSSSSPTTTNWNLAFDGPTMFDGPYHSIGLTAATTITVSGAATLDGADITGPYGGVPNNGNVGPTFILTKTGTLTTEGSGGSYGNDVIGTFVDIDGKLDVNAATSIGGCGEFNTTDDGCSGVIDGPISDSSTLNLDATDTEAAATATGSGNVVLQGPLNAAGRLDVGNVTVNTECEAICNVNNTVISAPLHLTGTLSLNGAANLASSAKGSVVGGFSLPEGGSLGANSVVDQASLTVDGPFYWNGGFISDPSSQSPQPTITVAPGSTAQIGNNAGSIAHWTLNLQSPLTTPSAPAFAMDSGAELMIANASTWDSGTDITNDGSGLIDVTGVGSLAPTSGSNATFDVPLHNAGTIGSDGGTLTVNPLTNSGDVALGTGTISDGSSFTAGKEASVTIAGTTAGSEYGQLQVSGSAALKGSLAITTAPSFSPSLGQTFEVVTSGGTTTGKFSPVTQSITPSGLAYKQSTSASGDTLTAVTATDLAVSASGPSTANVGDPIDYTGTVTNNGPNNDTGVRVSFTLPSGVTYDSASPGCTQTGSKVTCTAGALASGDQASFTVNTTAAQSGTQTATVTTSGSVFDPNATNNTATVATSVS